MSKIPFKNYLYVALGINIAVILMVLIALKILPPQVPLFYGLPQGEEQLASPILLTLPAVVSLFIVLINFLLARVIKEEFLRKILAVAGIISALFPLVTTIKIILLVGAF